MGEKTKRPAPDDAAAFFADILENAVKPHAQTIASITKGGDIAVVVFEPRKDVAVVAEAWGWDGTSPVFRLSNEKRKESLDFFRELGDEVSERWFSAERDGGRIFLLVHGATFLLNITKDGLTFEPGSLDSQEP